MTRFEFTSARSGDHEVLGISTASLRIEILPELGGRIWAMEDRQTGRQWIWHRADVAPRRLPLGTDYDDNWAGGWEQLFPNDAKGEFDGRMLPDHGEWWTLAWSWEMTEWSDARATLHLQARGAVTMTALDKWITVNADERRLDVRYRIENRGDRDLKFLFKEHLPIAISPSHRIELPSGRVTPVDLGFSTRIREAGPFSWPTAGGGVDLSTCPDAEFRHREFVYVADLPEGWCGVFDQASKSRLRVFFDRDVFPYVWLFLTYGGWRDLYTAVLEPCTNMPKDLGIADSLGQCARLTPGASLETTVSVELS